MGYRRGLLDLPAPTDAQRIHELEDAIRAMARAEYYAAEEIIDPKEAQSLVIAESLRVLGEVPR